MIAWNRSLWKLPYTRIAAALLAVGVLTLILWGRPVKSEREVDKRMSAGKKVALRHLVPAMEWKALCLNTGIALLLLGLAPLASRPLSRPGESPPLAKLTRGQWAALLAASGIFLAHGIPRLSQSLWGDEEYLVGHFIADQVEQTPTGLVITPAPWMHTLWDAWRPTNHFGYTWVARCFHDTFFTRPTGPKDGFYSEVLVRLPVLLAGLASIWALAWCLRLWGYARALPWVVLAYAGHAWLVRFGVDARGYGFTLLLVFLALDWLALAVRTGAWRWWLLLGFTQFYLLWSYLGTLHAVLTICVSSLIGLWLTWSGPDRWVVASRWLVANLMTTILCLIAFMPVVPPYLKFAEQKALVGDLDLPWMKDLTSYLLCGAPWNPWASGNPLHHSLSQSALHLPAQAAAALALSLALYGAWRLLRDRQGRCLLVFLLGGLALLLLQLKLSHTKPYHWYTIPSLPALLFLWAVALHRLPDRLGKIAGVALVGCVHLFGWQQTQLLKTHPIEANRDSVALTRQVTNPRHPDYGRGVITAYSLMNTGSYDPGGVEFETADELKALMQRADAEGKPLWVNFGFRLLYNDICPDIIGILDNQTWFERIAQFPGQLVSTSREVVRYRAGSYRPTNP
jgi:hypothetical protein